MTQDNDTELFEMESGASAEIETSAEGPPPAVPSDAESGLAQDSDVVDPDPQELQSPEFNCKTYPT